MGWRRGQAYSQDLRDRVLAAEGTAEVVSTRFGVSRSYVIKARQRRDRLGDASAGPQWSHTPAKLAGHDAALCARVQSVPDATLAELVEWARTELDVCVSIKPMWKALRRLKLTLKKRP
jgi:transposase